ncbi:hypothetical protein DL95DRAFT_30968 [Leptodontidium sp. 2 PMI_412]|nr:hypothetical protein DL95DRAFT_30968 [Leptodontidium sp. 2 PMI_412]
MRGMGIAMILHFCSTFELSGAGLLAAGAEISRSSRRSSEAYPSFLSPSSMPWFICFFRLECHQWAKICRSYCIDEN